MGLIPLTELMPLSEEIRIQMQREGDAMTQGKEGSQGGDKHLRRTCFADTLILKLQPLDL